MQHILVVEDDLDIQELLKNFLQEVGYEITIASDGMEAIVLFSSMYFDLILLDIMLPKINGFAVCELIRKQSQIPIIMLTALNGEEEQIKGLDLQVDDYITKPFSMPILVRSMEIINTMESMVQEILTVSRMKSSKIELKKEIIHFSDMLKHEYALFEDLIINKRIDWNESISSDLSIIGDKALIQKAINNLISNAIVYSPEDSSIYLTAFSEEGTVCFLLENTGVYIPDSEIIKLFDAFYRVEYSRNKRTGGSGLGLYIVKTILDQHQAEYSIENTKRGVLFTIRF